MSSWTQIQLSYSWQITNVIWQKAASLTCYPSWLRMDLSSDPCESAHSFQTASRSAKRFCRAHKRDQQTDRPSDHSTRSAALGGMRILCSRCMRLGLLTTTVINRCYNIITSRLLCNNIVIVNQRWRKCFE